MSDSIWTGATGNAPVCLPVALTGRLPDYLTTYVTVEQIQLVSDTKGADAFVMAALLDRETMGGTTKDLDRPGPSGTGDRAPRNPKGKYGMALPPDGRGWGRGLWQADYGAPNSPNRIFCTTVLPDGRFAWEDPVQNGLFAAGLIADALAQFDGQYDAAICSFNAGGDGNVNVVNALARLTSGAGPKARLAALDAITTGGNYVSDVLRRRDAFLKTDPTQGA